MPARARWNAPWQPISSPAVITRTTPLVPANSLAMFPIAATKAATPHFMSLEPRPYILPSMISPANASTLQEAFPSGTVSTWPVKHSGSLLPTALVLAMRLARLPARQRYKRLDLISCRNDQRALAAVAGLAALYWTVTAWFQ